jgi:hypothetical protein
MKDCSDIYLKEAYKQRGAVEACWAHNSEVGRSKLLAAMFPFSCFYFINIAQYKKKNDKIRCFFFRNNTIFCSAAYNHTQKITQHLVHMKKIKKIAGQRSMIFILHG